MTFSISFPTRRLKSWSCSTTASAISDAVVEQLQDFKRRVGKLIEKVMQNQVAVIAGVDVFHDIGRLIVFLLVGAPVEKDLAAWFDQRHEFIEDLLVVG